MTPAEIAAAQIVGYLAGACTTAAGGADWWWDMDGVRLVFNVRDRFFEVRPVECECPCKASAVAARGKAKG